MLHKRVFQKLKISDKTFNRILLTYKGNKCKASKAITICQPFSLKKYAVNITFYHINNSE